MTAVAAAGAGRHSTRGPFREPVVGRAGPYPHGAVSGGPVSGPRRPSIHKSRWGFRSSTNARPQSATTSAGWPADGHLAEQSLTHEVDHIDDAGVRLDDVEALPTIDRQTGRAPQSAGAG